MKAVWDWKKHFAEVGDKDVFDTYIAEALLSEGRYLPTEEKAYEMNNASTPDTLAAKQKERLSAFPKLGKLFYEVELPLAPILFKMEELGITLDIKELDEIGRQILSKSQVVKKDILDTIGYEINLNSSPQVGEYLVEKEGVPLGRTKTGKYATNEGELSKFQDQFEVIRNLLQYRALAKLHSTYVQSLIDKVDSEGRVHTTYHQVYVNTGRLASSNPNLQNIPVTSVFGNKIKGCFKPTPGYVLVSFDYSQQELRIMAHLSGEPKLIEAFKNKQDVHKITAGQLFGVHHEEVTAEQRRVGKTINFGIIYGMSGYGMSENLQIGVAEGEEFIQNFYRTFPRIKEYYDNYLNNARIHGFVETILGRRRYVFENPQRKLIDNGARRVLMNFPIQGSAADLMKLAMVTLHQRVLHKETAVRLLLQIHDDLVFEIKNNQDLKKHVAAIKEIMCNIYPLTVPMEVDVKIGMNWGEMKPLT